MSVADPSAHGPPNELLQLVRVDNPIGEGCLENLADLFQNPIKGLVTLDDPSGMYLRLYHHSPFGSIDNDEDRNEPLFT